MDLIIDDNMDNFIKNVFDMGITLFWNFIEIYDNLE